MGQNKIMLKKRIIPTLLWKNYTLVKGINFDSWRTVGSVLPSIKVYNFREVDELIIVDILSTINEQEIDYTSVEEFSQECFVPLTIGGGVDHINKVEKLLRSGADKVCINSASYVDPSLIEKAAYKFGEQCVVASIDVRKSDGGKHFCYSHSGTRPTNIDVIEWAKEMQDRGAGEILLTSIDNDGTMKGYDLELICKITNILKIPVIASGGAGSYSDMLEAFTQSNASAVAAASIFHFTEMTPKEAKNFLANNGINVRIF